ncbi:MAG TPA: xanthine dehydrogenase small subunit [Salinivirgaceae bacterium]|mgnify:CR=1 FL=1|nr:xanthine dehydrogenase small subunit [Salinivirgaceae bacterium]
MNKGSIRFIRNFKIVEIDFNQTNFLPSTTILNYLRQSPDSRGTKEGCGEGDCGACTVVVATLCDDNVCYQSINACLTFLPALHGKMLITVEDLSDGYRLENIHPIQQWYVKEHASQCGFCTPGFVMSTFAMVKNKVVPTRDNITDALAGNLCRCTGYQSIYTAVEKSLQSSISDKFDARTDEIIHLLKSIETPESGIEIKTRKQTYFLANNLTEALRFKQANPKAVVVNGSTDIAVQQNKKFLYHPIILDLSRINELNNIIEDDKEINLGSGVPLEQLKQQFATKLPILKEALTFFASQQIRNVATLGGNLCNASPVGDLIPVMIALKAKAIIQNFAKQREIPFEEFIVGYRKTAMADDELLTRIIIPKPSQKVHLSFEKVSNRQHVDISTVSLAARWTFEKETITEIILAYGGMADRVKRAKNTESFLMGKPLNEQTLKQASVVIESDFTPISDSRSGKEFRMNVAKNLLLKCLLPL